MGRVLVTGATGTVGRHVVELLRESGADALAMTRDAGDLTDPASLPLGGVGSVFLLWPFATAEGARAVVEAVAARAGRVVYLSSAARREHEREVERLIEESGLEWTFLRPHAFAAGALRWARQVRAGVVRGAYGQAASAVVHERDVAAAAVRALLGDGHAGGAYELSGPETLTRTDQVRVISEVTGVPVRWEEVPPDVARAGLLARGWPPEATDEVLRAQAASAGAHEASDGARVAVAAGAREPVPAAVEQVTARTFAEWVKEHAGVFRTPPVPPVTMRAARIHRYGDASAIQVDEVDTPRPGPGEVLVEVAATSFNPSEVGLRSGMLPEVFQVELPHTLGWDVSGTVVRTGPDVTAFAPGDRVHGLVQGAAAEYVVAPAASLAGAPECVPLADAAAVPVAGLTAWQAVHEHAGVAAGQSVLVNGAGGGIGVFAVQFAKLTGAHVTATASPRSAAAVRRLGADDVVDYTAVPLPGGMDVLLNLAAVHPEEARSLAGLGRRTVTVAAPIEGGTHFVARNDTGHLAEIAALVDEGAVVIEVAESHPLSELAEIHRRAESGDTRGKITIYPDESVA